jgi:transcription elongation factor Elf1
LSRIDVERFENLKELVDKQRQEEKTKDKKVKKNWDCYQCGKGHMQLHIFNRRDGVFYYRSCTLCENRTRMKKHHKNVEES